MSDQDLSAAERGPECPSCGVPFDQHDGFATMCGKLAASPSWQDLPTGPGLWLIMCDDGSAGLWNERDSQKQRAAGEWFIGRVFGPIPADKER